MIEYILGGLLTVSLVGNAALYSRLLSDRRKVREEKDNLEENVELIKLKTELSNTKAKAVLTFKANEELERTREELVAEREVLRRDYDEDMTSYRILKERYELLQSNYEDAVRNLEATKKNYEELTQEQKDNYERKIEELNLHYREAEEAYFSKKKILEESLEEKRRLVEAIQRQMAEDNRLNQYKLNITNEEYLAINKIKEQLDKTLPASFSTGLSKLVWEVIVRPATSEMIKTMTSGEAVSGIYRISNETNGLQYIGRSVNVGTRLTEHIRGAVGASTKTQQEIQKAMGKDLTNWTFEILEEVDRELLPEREKFYIDFYKTNVHGYNKQRGG